MCPLSRLSLSRRRPSREPAPTVLSSPLMRGWPWRREARLYTFAAPVTFFHMAKAAFCPVYRWDPSRGGCVQVCASCPISHLFRPKPRKPPVSRSGALQNMPGAALPTRPGLPPPASVPHSVSILHSGTHLKLFTAIVLLHEPPICPCPGQLAAAIRPAHPAPRAASLCGVQCRARVQPWRAPGLWDLLHVAQPASLVH